MERDFFKNTRELRENIKLNVFDQFNKIQTKKVKDIVLQRQQSSS
jgi:hypothetical protein